MSPVEIMLDQVEWKQREGAAPLNGNGLPYATHEGVLYFGEFALRCYRLNTGEAVFDADDFKAAFEGLLA